MITKKHKNIAYLLIEAGADADKKSTQGDAADSLTKKGDAIWWAILCAKLKGKKQS